MPRIERIKLKEKINEVGGKWTVVKLLEPTIIEFKGESKEIAQISIEGGTVQKRGLDDKEKRYINFGYINDNRVKNIINKVLYINNENSNILLEIKKSDEENVIDWINNGFSVVFDPSGQIINPHGNTLENTNKNSVNWEKIYPVIREYVRNNPDKFYLEKDRTKGDDGISFDRDLVGRGVMERWWCKVVSEEEAKNLITISPHGRPISGTRKILFENSQNKALNFIFFTPEQYEELKQLLPDDRACKVEGCYNNYADTFNYHPDYETRVENGLCGYHRRVSQNNNANDTDTNTNHSNTSSDLDRQFRENWKKIFTDFDKFKQVEGGSEWGEIRRKLMGWTIVDLHLNTFDDNSSFSALNFLPDEEKRDLITKMENLIQKASASNNDGGENPTGGNNQENNTSEKNLPQFKQEVIDLITNALNHSPVSLSNNDLTDFNQHWKEEINRSNDKGEIENVRDRVLSDIQTKKQDKLNSDKLEKLVREAEKMNDYAKLAEKMQQIGSFRGQKKYNDLKERIDALESRLSKLNPEKYRDDSVQEINRELTQKGVKKDDLSSDTKKDLDKIKNREIKDPVQIQKIKENAHQEIGRKNAEDKLVKILTDYKNSSDPETRKKLKTEIYKFLSATKNNDFYRWAWQKHKKELDQILSAENIQQEDQNFGNFPTVTVIIICSCLVLMIVVIILAVRETLGLKKIKKKKKAR